MIRDAAETDIPELVRLRGLLGWFDERGIRRVDLNASSEGQSLYRGFGFADHPDPVLSRKRGP